jgi:hypothetical protein
MREPKELLDVRIGGVGSMRSEFLESAAKPNGTKIPPHWRSNRCYEELQRQGLIAVGPDTPVSYQRHWVITDAGRSYLEQNPARIKLRGI